MDKKLKREWVKALRSGKYAQATHRLQSHGNRYCCLGVLCRVAQEVRTFRPKTTVNLDEETVLAGETLDEQPSRFGLGAFDDMGPETLQMKIAYMNDHGKSFAEIADWIEKNVEAK